MALRQHSLSPPISAPFFQQVSESSCHYYVQEAHSKPQDFVSVLSAGIGPFHILSYLIAPLRSSDRRKLKQRISETYSLSAETSELLVPDGLLSQKFSTHLNELGVSSVPYLDTV